MSRDLARTLWRVLALVCSLARSSTRLGRAATDELLRTRSALLVLAKCALACERAGELFAPLTCIGLLAGRQMAVLGDQEAPRFDDLPEPVMPKLSADSL
jgi:hypothetical protein